MQFLKRLGMFCMVFPILVDIEQKVCASVLLR